MLVGARVEDAAVGRDDRGAAERVAGQAELPAQPAHAAAQREAGDARDRHDPARRREPVRLGGRVDRAPAGARADPGPARPRVHRDAVHLRAVDDERAVADGEARDVVPAARIEIGSPSARASPIAATTSSVERTRAMTAGWWSIMPFQTRRASSKAASPGRSSRSAGIEAARDGLAGCIRASGRCWVDPTIPTGRCGAHDGDRILTRGRARVRPRTVRLRRCLASPPTPPIPRPPSPAPGRATPRSRSSARTGSARPRPCSRSRRRSSGPADRWSSGARSCATTRSGSTRAPPARPSCGCSSRRSARSSSSRARPTSSPPTAA